MKIAVVCANGSSGQKIVREAVGRGHDVTAVVRGVNYSDTDKVITRDLFELTSEDLEGFDAVIDCFGVWDENKMYEHTASIKH
ncbi:MAG: NAD(P)-dependent oxidoreductase, partial [Eggerthellaceae bacterium]|nr:NAD(P)-dependent oxidoreductase [Eggerthellaceae bacterium]